MLCFSVNIWLLIITQPGSFFTTVAPNKGEITLPKKNYFNVNVSAQEWCVQDIWSQVTVSNGLMWFWEVLVSHSDSTNNSHWLTTVLQALWDTKSTSVPVIPFSSCLTIKWTHMIGVLWTSVLILSLIFSLHVWFDIAR